MAQAQYSFQRPRMAGDSLIEVSGKKESSKYEPQAVSGVQKNFKSLADITQALTGKPGTQTDRIERVLAGRGLSRDAAQRMYRQDEGA